jgi:hypothetical protein
MRSLITDPTLVVDYALWDTDIRPLELIDGGVTDVILRIGRAQILDPQFLRNGEKIAKTGYLRLHGYFWDDPIFSATMQAEFAVETVRKSGLPVLSIWADQEQWWGSWEKWCLAVNKKIPWSEVPVLKAGNLDLHFRIFAEALNSMWPGGHYGGRGFITSYAPAMAKWLGKYKIWFAAWMKQPDKKTEMSWDEYRKTWIPDADPIIRDTGIKKENFVGHQLTGDRCLLPGSYTTIAGIIKRRNPTDVSIFSKAYMESLASGITPAPPAPPEPEPPEIAEYIVLGAHLWVRKGPSDNAKLVDSLTKSQRVIVLEMEGEFSRIEKPAGWVRSAWLTPLS